VEVVPSNFEEKVRAGEQVSLRITYNAIDPQDEQFMEYLGHTHVTALNDALLIQSVADVQQQTSDVQQHVKSARSTLSNLDSGLSGVNPDQARQSLDLLSTALQALYTQPALSAARSGTDLARTRAQMVDLHDNLVALQNALNSGSLANQQQRIVETQNQLDNLDNRLQRLQGLSPQVIVSPLRQENVNLQGKAFSYMVYFAPGVTVLILQHIAVTLASLSLVRERNDNALEFFSVSPTSMLEVLVGKYFAYLFFLSLISAGLIALLVFALGVPFNGELGVFAGFMLLFLVAALGLGFFISVLSESETQAVQLAMLSLLLTVFFSGFVLPLDQFQNAIKYVGYVVPMTHGMPGLQAIMLEGQTPSMGLWMALSLIGVLSFGVVSVIWHRQGRWLH
jgi:ABC-2 type transport system permease protein